MRPTRLLTGLVSMALLVVGLVALLPDCAYACSCPVTPSTQQGALAESTAIFSGQVLDIEEGPKNTTVSFRVSEVWRGPKRETLEVTTPSGGGNFCGYTFSEGRKYLVYAYGKEEPFKVDLCSETRQLSKASMHQRVLGDGQTPGANHCPTPREMQPGSERLGWPQLRLFAAVERRLEQSSPSPRPAVAGTHVE